MNGIGERVSPFHIALGTSFLSHIDNKQTKRQEPQQHSSIRHHNQPQPQPHHIISFHSTHNLIREKKYSECLIQTITREICNGWKSDRTLASLVLSEGLGRFCADLLDWSSVRIGHYQLFTHANLVARVICYSLLGYLPIPCAISTCLTTTPTKHQDKMMYCGNHPRARKWYFTRTVFTYPTNFCHETTTVLPVGLRWMMCLP